MLLLELVYLRVERCKLRNHICAGVPCVRLNTCTSCSEYTTQQAVALRIAEDDVALKAECREKGKPGNE